MATRDSDVMQVLDSAMGAFGDALKTGVKAQEEMLKWCTSTVDNTNPLGEWQKRARQFFDDGVPAVQKQAEEWLKLVDQNYRRSVDLLKKAVDSEHGGTLDNIHEKLRNLWEESVTVVKENTQAMAQANVKLMETWSQLLKKNLEQCDKGFAAAAHKAAK